MNLNLNYVNINRKFHKNEVNKYFLENIKSLCSYLLFYIKSSKIFTNIYPASLLLRSANIHLDLPHMNSTLRQIDINFPQFYRWKQM